MTPKEITKFSKFLSYALDRRPDEFGLLPDERGFFKIKSVLQALREEPEWRHVREGHLNELLISERPASIEIEDGFIRARLRRHQPAIRNPSVLPKVLYTAIRQRAYPAVHDQGLKAGGARAIFLSPDQKLAERLGRRSDNSPVLLTVHVDQCRAAGTTFHQFGELLYVADQIPVGAFSGPPLPKIKPLPPRPQKAEVPDRPKTPGSFFPDLLSRESKGEEGQRPRRPEVDWKKERRRARKAKLNQR